MNKSIRYFNFLAVFVAILLMIGNRVLATDVKPIALRCDYIANPLGIGSPNPRLFWKIRSDVRGQKQAAYQILLASTSKYLAKNRADLWDSGKCESDETIQILYNGKPLKSSQQVFWKVRVWDANGKISAWSKPATWTMGILDNSDWHANWITAPNTNYSTILFRREFVAGPKLKRALLNICGLGQYELTINGHQPSDGLFSPGWTKYDKTCLYDTYNIRQWLHVGKNAIGIFLGAGMYDMHDTKRFVPPGYTPYTYGPLKVIAQLRLEYTDGSVEIVGTDKNWRVAPGPITFSSVYDGEDFDARLIQEGWDETDFDDSKWVVAQVVDGPGGKLRGISCASSSHPFF